jgi:transketolase
LQFLCTRNKGVEVCTGPLGQGISNAVGLAIAERHLAENFNVDDKFKIFDHHTYVICGDGCMQEGVASEACSLAGHLGLGRLIVLYDDNNITIDGETELSFTEDVLKRFEAYGWHTQYVDTVQETVSDLRDAIAKAQAVTDKPSIIKVKTAIGYGSPSKQGSEEAHGAPLGAADLAGAKKFYGLPEDKSFYVPEEVYAVFKESAAAGDAKRTEWDQMFADYAKEHPDMAAELSRRIAGKLPEGILEKLPVPVFGIDKDAATRKHSQNCLTAIGPLMPELIGGSADLTPSNLTNYPGVTDVAAGSYKGRYLRFGVREHAMVSVCNGMFAHGALRPYCATFLVFAGYCVGAIRLSALSKFGIIFVFTHDSIGLGEDGPTHQPIETLESLRSMPNLIVYRPADGIETSAAYQVALERRSTPTVLALSRTNVPGLEKSSMEGAMKGAYSIVDEEVPDLIIISTGTEVAFSLDASKLLLEEGIKTRVVSMPSQEIFLEQSIEYQTSILPGDVPTMSVEASSPHGWARFSHAQVAMNEFGRSGAGNDVFAKFGFTPTSIASRGKELVEYYKNSGKAVPNLMDRPIFSVVTDGH